MSNIIKNRIVPVIITGDVDPTPEVSVQNKQRALSKINDLFGLLKIKSTFFCVARTAKLLKNDLLELQKAGHEIGCHGLTHQFEEEYDKMPEHLQRNYLVEATQILEDLSGKKILSFRGPRVKTSHITHRILNELGYNSDSSICSQRIDFISSNLINWGWLKAPRLPYHPDLNNAYKQGSAKIWVVPVSAMIMPFISGIIYTFGLSYMKMLFRLLRSESLKNGKPIVYLYHPVEFTQKTKNIRRTFSFRNLFIEGFRVRRSSWLREQDNNKRFEDNRKLLEYIKSYSDVRFMTLNEYVKNHLNGFRQFNN
jgi:peptidoglycan/xylan/chitin deacetylase (PgdA/CDA1 family)